MAFLKTLRNFFVSVWFFIGFFLYVWVYGSFRLVQAKFIERKHGKEAAVIFLKDVLSSFGKNVFKLLFCKVDVIGKENIPSGKGGLVIISNHQSLLDIPLIVGYVHSAGFVSKKELLKAPVIGSFIKAVGCIPIDRKNPAQAAVALRNLTKSLLNGNKICIFPEGTRTDDGHVADFKPGSLSIPMKYKIPILPVTIDGDYKLMKKNSFLLNPSTIKVFIDQPVDASAFSDEQALIEHIRAKMINNIAKGELL